MLNKIKRFLWFFDIDIKRRCSLSTFEANMMSVIAQKHVDIVVDVGANTGQFAVLLRSLGYSGKIISFEPNSDAYKLLEKKASADKDWECLPLALSDSSGEENFTKYNFSVLSSFSTLSEDGKKKFPDAKEISCERIEVRRLDSVLNSSRVSKKSLLLKTDTQGFDLQVFLGAAGIMDNVVGVVCELSLKNLYVNGGDWLKEISVYEKYGFHLSGVYPVSRNDSLELLEVNAIFVRASFSVG